jgi:hypothetical protein
MIVIVVVVGVLVIVEATRLMIVALLFSGMAVHETVWVAVFMLVKMFVDGFAVPMLMGMQVAMGMIVLVFVLQRVDGPAAALPIGIGQAVEIAQPFIL